MHEPARAIDVAKPQRRETLSMVDELRHQTSVAYAEADAELQRCKKQIGEAEKELADINTTAQRKKSLKYKLVRLMAKRASLLRALEKATGDLDGKKLRAAEPPAWTERRL